MLDDCRLLYCGGRAGLFLNPKEVGKRIKGMSSLENDATILLPGLTKTCPPDLSKIIPRPQLDKIFEKNNEKMLILIIGQAAQGKSTTAATWYFKRNNHSSIWITLDQEDSDPVHLFYLLVQALHQERKEKAIGNLSAMPSHTMGPQDGLYRYREWALAIYKTFPDPVQVFLTAWIDWLPSPSLFISSRS
jgi:hypothetical protein